jgi:macrolide-specific efflux system membrane fusion protein
MRTILKLCCLLLAGVGDAFAGDPIRVESVLITLIEQVDVPAADSGALVSISVREGELVAEGAVLAQLEDSEARQMAERAKLEFEIAAKEAQNVLKVQYARKSLEVAQAELRRATDSIGKYRNSVSQSELDTLRLTADGAALELEQAEHNLAVAKLTSQLKQREYAIATSRLDRRRLLAPIAGVVVQLKRQRGEWVEPGNAVLRLVRMDRLRCEGFLSARDLVDSLDGRKVTVSVDLPGKPKAQFPGKVTFISPEVNPVNGQVRFWAEVENPELLLKPGLQASLTIEAAEAKAVADKTADAEPKP